VPLSGDRYVSHQVQQLLDLRERISDLGKLYDAMQAYQLPTELRTLYQNLARDSVSHSAVNNWIHLSISLRQPDMWVGGAQLDQASHLPTCSCPYRTDAGM
jgi:hypothetical protein